MALVERVRASAEKHAVLAFGALARTVPEIGGVALRRCPALPETILGRLADHRSRDVADWVMYRQALARAAEARGWAVSWFDSKTVFGLAAQVLRVAEFGAYFSQRRATMGPPWNQDHKLALAAAITIVGA